jgi:hypothetical protein
MTEDTRNSDGILRNTMSTQWSTASRSKAKHLHDMAHSWHCYTIILVSVSVILQQSSRHCHKQKTVSTLFNDAFSVIKIIERRSRWPCSLRRRSYPHGYWDCGFEFRPGHRCLSSCLCCVDPRRYRSLRQADHLSKGDYRVSK